MSDELFMVLFIAYCIVAYVVACFLTIRGISKENTSLKTQLAAAMEATEAYKKACASHKESFDSLHDSFDRAIRVIDRYEKIIGGQGRDSEYDRP